MNLKKLFFVFVLFLSMIILPFLALAQGLVPCGGEGQAACTFCDFFKLISNLVNFIAFRLSPPIAALMFLVGGFYFLTAGGSQEKVKTGQKIFTQTVVGLVIMFIAWLLVNTIITALARGSDNFMPEAWYSFKCEFK